MSYDLLGHPQEKHLNQHMSKRVYFILDIFKDLPNLYMYQFRLQRFSKWHDGQVG